MPRRRNNNQEEQIFFIEGEGNILCLPHLKNTYYEMCVETKKKLECSVCLDELCCKRCFCLLMCGHSLHADCWLRMTEKRCPVCRLEPR